MHPVKHSDATVVSRHGMAGVTGRVNGPEDNARPSEVQLSCVSAWELICCWPGKLNRV